MTNNVKFEAMQQLFGYGNAKARFWVVGLEEHCGDDDDIAARIALRTANPQKFLDREEFHRQLENLEPLEKVAVWRIAREIYRSAFDADTEVGRVDTQCSDLLLSEIMPLPRRQTNQWPTAYLDWFPNAKTYIKHARPIMVKRLIAMVKEHRPKVVLLHGKTQHNRWVHLRSSPLKDKWKNLVVINQTNRKLSWQYNDGTLWILTNNLVNNGFVNFGHEQIEQIADVIRKNIEISVNV